MSERGWALAWTLRNRRVSVGWGGGSTNGRLTEVTEAAREEETSTQREAETFIPESCATSAPFNAMLHHEERKRWDTPTRRKKGQLRPWLLSPLGTGEREPTSEHTRRCWAGAHARELETLQNGKCEVARENLNSILYVPVSLWHRTVWCYWDTYALSSSN